MSGGGGFSLPWYVSYPLYFVDGCYKVFTAYGEVRLDDREAANWCFYRGRKIRVKATSQPKGQE